MDGIIYTIQITHKHPPLPPYKFEEIHFLTSHLYLINNPLT